MSKPRSHIQNNHHHHHNSHHPPTHSHPSRSRRPSKEYSDESEIVDYTLHHASEVLTLNVGGTKFMTLYGTIARFDKSFFSHYLKIDARTGKIVRFNSNIIDDGTGAIFIDRDGHLFAHVLQFMRDGKHVALPRDASLLNQIQREAIFYNIDGLRALTTDLLRDGADPMSSQTLDNIHSQVKQIAHSLAFTSFNNRT